MKVKVGIIGCGQITKRSILPNFKKCSDAVIRSFTDINKDRALKLKREFRLEDCSFYEDYKEMLRREDLDAVVIATPNYLHFQMAIDTARMKKHILITKPMCLSLSEADKMIEEADKNKVFLMVEQTLRFDPVHERTKEVIEKRMIGRIIRVFGRLGHAGPKFWSKESEWFYDRKKSGGGTLLDSGIHIIDLLRWLTNKEVSSVFASIDRIERKYPVEDNAQCFIKFKDGSIGGFETSWTTRPYEVSTQIYGEKGMILTRADIEKKLTVKLANAKLDPNCQLREIDIEIPPQSKYTSPFHYFIECVRQRRKPFINGEEARKSLAVILAAYESVRKNKWVKVGG